MTTRPAAYLGSGARLPFVFHNAPFSPDRLLAVQQLISIPSPTGNATMAASLKESSGEKQRGCTPEVPSRLENADARTRLFPDVREASANNLEREA